jgi:anti-sigma factor RsiW
MSNQAAERSTCRTDEIVAYLDGELEERLHAPLELHLTECASCASELNLQQRLLAELESVLATDPGLELPRNFAQVVAARAQSDLRGVREPRERKRAIGLCCVLVVLSIALLGGAAAGESVLGPLRVIWRAGAALFTFLGHALYDAGAGVAVIARGFGGRFLFQSRPISVLTILLFASALLVLRRLLVGYHRTRNTV